MTNVASSAFLETALEAAKTVAHEAGALLRGRFYDAKSVSYKADASPVTDADLLSEELIRGRLAKKFPDIGLEGEELGAAVDGNGLRWIIDPLDGTRNYAGNIPHFAVNLALAEGDEVLVGVTHDPMRQETFHAVKGGGAFLNGRPMKVSGRTAVAQCIIGLDLATMGPRALAAIKLAQSLYPDLQSIRIFGSSALGLAYAAAGRLDVFLHHTLAPWDIAPGLLLVREAGGEVLDRLTQGRASIQSTGAIASSKRLLRQFLRLTQEQEWYTVA